MALFGFFDNDPFFRQHNDHMREMDRMMNQMMTPMMTPFFPGMRPMMPLEGPPVGHVNPRDLQLRPQQQPQHQPGFGAMSPFDMLSGRDMFTDVMANFNTMANTGNCHSFASSNVMSYTIGPDGKPQMYQASASTRQAPGGLRETRKTEADSLSGVQRMAIGRHLNDRGHVIEKAKNTRTGEIDESQDFLNLEETQAEDFNREWTRRANDYRGIGRSHHHRAPREIAGGSRDDERRRRAARYAGRDGQPLAIEGGPAPRSNRRS